MYLFNNKSNDKASILYFVLLVELHYRQIERGQCGKSIFCGDSHLGPSWARTMDGTDMVANAMANEMEQESTYAS